MTDQTMSGGGPPAALRRAIAHDFAAVRALRPPGTRALLILPLGALLLVAAPLTFDVRVDAVRLGWLWTWGASTLQLAAGMALVAAALRDAVPGRSWSTSPLLAWLALPIVLVIAITFVTFAESQTILRGPWWWFGAMCFAGSCVSALPAVLLAGILAERAYVTRPLRTGALLGLAAGVMADGGWRLFCHFSQPDHVLTAHLGGVVMSGLTGALWLSWLTRRVAESRDEAGL